MKKIIIGIMSAVMMTGCSFSEVSLKREIEQPESFEPYEIVESESSFEGKDSEWYRSFCEQLLNYEFTPTVEGKISSGEFDKAYREMRNDIPEVFWLGPAWFKNGSKHTTLEFQLMEGCTEESVKKMHMELEEKAKEIIEGIPANSTDYEKVLYIHDYIAKNTSYDHSIDYEKGSGLCYTAYGCLVQKLAVCQGYAEAFTYIMNKLGIETGVVQGRSYPGGHAWNYVCLDGEYYWLDITWDDTDNVSFPVEYGYFLFTDEMQSRTRKVDFEENFIPKCTSLEYNYFAKNECLFGEYDFEAVKNLWEKNSGKPYVEMMFTDFDSYCTAVNALMADGDYFKLKGAATYHRDDRNYTFTIGREQE